MSSVTPGASTPCSNPCTSNFSRAWSMESEHEAIWEESNFQNTPHDLQSNWWMYFSNTTMLVFPFWGCCPSGQGFSGAQPYPCLLPLHPGEASHCSLAKLRPGLSALDSPQLINWPGGFLGFCLGTACTQTLLFSLSLWIDIFLLALQTTSKLLESL